MDYDKYRLGDCSHILLSCRPNKLKGRNFVRARAVGEEGGVRVMAGVALGDMHLSVLTTRTLNRAADYNPEILNCTVGDTRGVLMEGVHEPYRAPLAGVGMLSHCGMKYAALRMFLEGDSLGQQLENIHSWLGNYLGADAIRNLGIADPHIKIATATKRSKLSDPVVGAIMEELPETVRLRPVGVSSLRIRDGM